MINTNRFTPVRGKQDMTDYKYNDTFYKAICDEQSIYKECSFPQNNNK